MGDVKTSNDCAVIIADGFEEKGSSKPHQQQEEKNSDGGGESGVDRSNSGYSSSKVTEKDRSDKKDDNNDSHQDGETRQQQQHDDGDEEHEYEMIDNNDDNLQRQQQQPLQQQQQQEGLWMGIDLGTSNCACAIWDSARGHPKWIRLPNLAIPQGNHNYNRKKAGRILPSAVQIIIQTQQQKYDNNNNSMEAAGTLRLDQDMNNNSNDSLLWKDILKWNPQWREQLLKQQQQPTSTPQEQDSLHLAARVGYHVLEQLQQHQQEQEQGISPQDCNNYSDQSPTPSCILTSMKRVLGVCDVTKLEDLDPVFRQSLPFVLEETGDGNWVVPIYLSGDSPEQLLLYVRPIHVAAIILQAMRFGAQDYLAAAIPKKKMCVPGLIIPQDDNDDKTETMKKDTSPSSATTTTSSRAATATANVNVNNVVIGVPAYFGQAQRKAVEEAARLAGFAGHVSTLTESTAAAMAYGLFVNLGGGGGGRTPPATATTGSEQSSSSLNQTKNPPSQQQKQPPPPPHKAILVIDMGGGTTDITIAQMANDANHNDGNSNNGEPKNGGAAADDDEDDDESPQQHFRVILTDGDNRLGGEDMDQALYDLVVRKAIAVGHLSSQDDDAEYAATLTTTTKSPSSLRTQSLATTHARQSLLRSCQQAKEQLCGDVDHGDPPAESATVQIPDSIMSFGGGGGGGLAKKRIDLTQGDLNDAIRPLLERTEQLMERALHRYFDKLSNQEEEERGDSSGSADHINFEDVIHEVILIGGATRVPALRQMLKDRFFSHLELCTSVNAMSAVAQGTAIQAAILSKQVPLHEVRSAMMLDTTPHSIGVLLSLDNNNNNNNEKEDSDESSGGSGSHRYVEIIPRDTPLPANGYATFYVADLDQKGVTIAAVESIIQNNPQTKSGTGSSSSNNTLYQPLKDFTFLLHRLTEPQREAILSDKEHPGLRPVDIGMTLGTDGAFHVSIFDPNDPDHIRKKEFYQKTKQLMGSDGAEKAEASLLVDYVVKTATTDWKNEGITAEEIKLIATAALLFVFYLIIKIVVPKHDILSEEDMARIL